jgi:hypothetical protein
MRRFLTAILLIISCFAFGQYAPKVGDTGSTAIFIDSDIFVSWAVSCNINRGLKNIAVPDSGYASAGIASSAIGKAGENGVVSLGDGGIATLTFEKPIVNGPGSDFAVFENSFDDFFLELAFVEVSSDGVNFFRFPSASLTQDSLQINTFGTLSAEKLNNLAGKYRGMYGTPFDLEELKWVSGIEVNNITHVKVIDVTGCISDNYATVDSYGNKINDPWPTCFPTGGFDLDAIGVIHQKTNANAEVPVFFYPNPFVNIINLDFFNQSSETMSIKIIDIAGRTVKSLTGNSNDLRSIDLSGIDSGVYWAVIYMGDEKISTKKIIKL